jgi:heme/copper-type cytochrome/quinol oxidase subunit 4
MAENKTQAEGNGNGYKEDRNIGFAVFILLLALTVGEFIIGYIAIDWSWPLWGIAIFKAALIIYYFMHVTKLFGSSEEEVHDNAN